jgi:hypothetical protein
MTHAFAVLLFAGSAFVAGAAQAANPPPIDRLMTESGLDQILVELGDGVAHSAADSGVTDKDLLGKWQAVSGTMFKIDRLNGRLGEALGKYALSEDDQAAVEKFYGSDLGKRLVAAEVASDRLDYDQTGAAIDEGKKITATLSARRSAQYGRYWDLANAPSLAIGDGLLRTGVLAVFLSHSHGGDPTIPWPAIDTAMDAVASKALPDIRDNMTWGNAYVYKDFSDDELETYLDFLASAAAQRFYAACTAALDEVVGDEVTRFGATIAGAVNAVAI